MENNPSSQDKDMQERTDGFNKELQPLLGKYELGLAALPVINPNGTLGAQPVIVSVRKPAGETPDPSADVPAPLSE